MTLTAPSEHGQHMKRDGTICECTPAGGINLAAWNAEVGRRWSDFITYMRREIDAGAQYCKSAECQQRGAIHFHALFRSTADLVKVRSRLRAIAMHVGFGHELDVQAVTGEAAAGYCAKYVSKSTDDRASCPWMDLQTGEVTGAMRVRTWTASRQWGLTMRALQRAQADWAAQRAAGPPAAVVPALAPALDSNGESSTIVLGGQNVVGDEPVGSKLS